MKINRIENKRSNRVFSYAACAAHITNEPRVNVEPSAALVASLRAEILELRANLARARQEAAESSDVGQSSGTRFKPCAELREVETLQAHIVSAAAVLREVAASEEALHLELELKKRECDLLKAALKVLHCLQCLCIL